MATGDKRVGVDALKAVYDHISGEIGYLQSVLDAMSDSTNMFDKTTATTGVRLAPTGVNYGDSNYYASDFIAVLPGVTYIKNSPVINAYHRAVLFNSSKKGVRAIDDSNVIVPQTGEAYIRFCGLQTEIDTASLAVFSADDRVARETLNILNDAAKSSYDGSDAPNIVHGVKDLATGVDLDGVNESGLYGLMGVADRYPNAPESLVSGMLIVIKDKVQLLYNLFKGVRTQYCRYKTASGWSNWSRTNVVAGDVPAVDSTLAVSGAAADAKATGDMLSSLQSAALSSFDGSDTPNIMHGVKVLASGVDLNTVNESGLYGLMGVADRHPNAPESLVSGIMYVIKDQLQIVHNVFKGMPTEYARYKTASGWSAWGRANLTRSDITAMCPNWINWTNIDDFGKTAGLQTASGIVSGTGYYHVTLAVNPSNRVKTVWTNSEYETPVIYETASGTLAAITTYTAEGNSFGKRFAIPSNAAKIHLNFRLTSEFNAGYFEEGVHDDYPATYSDMYCFEYAYGQKLNGKKVLCISDSMGYTDSRAIVQGRYHCYCAIGYPTWIRSTGAHVDVAGGGYSGKAFANNSEGDSIYKKIVTEQFDVSGYDVIMLVASGNDWRLKTTIGDAGSNTGVPNTEPGTMCGAIGAILAYIYANNPFCKVYMCPPPQKRMVQDSMSVARSYVDAQLDVADYWGLPVINLWNSGITGTTVGNYAELLYDWTHPNYFGAKMLGETIVNGLHSV